MSRLLEILTWDCRPGGILVYLMLEMLKLKRPSNFDCIYGVEDNEYVAAAVMAVNTRGE